MQGRIPRLRSDGLPAAWVLPQACVAAPWSPRQAEQGTERPAQQRAPLQDQIGLQKHVGLQCDPAAVSLDVGTIEFRGDLVGRFAQGQGTAGLRGRQDGLRDAGDLAAIGAELLIREGVVENRTACPSRTKPTARAGTYSSATRTSSAGTISSCRRCGSTAWPSVACSVATFPAAGGGSHRRGGRRSRRCAARYPRVAHATRAPSSPSPRGVARARPVIASAGSAARRAAASAR